MRHLPLLALGVGLAGCGGAATIDREANTAILEVRERADFVYTSCEGGGVGRRCGLILRHTAKASFREIFREKLCKERSTDDCQATFNRYIDAQLAERYHAADWHAVKRQCDRAPLVCDDPVKLELMLVDTHNAAIRERVVVAIDAIDRTRRRQHAEHDAAAALTVAAVTLAAAHAALDRPRCRAYPDIETGETVDTCAR